MYTLANNGIIHELLDNEIIVANLDSGIYYSLRGNGIHIWQLLLAGWSFEQIQKEWTDRYGANTDVSSFVSQLLDEELVRSNDGEKQASLPEDFTWPSEYSPPLFEKYEEMKDLLLLDPIHEVDEQGWPKRAE